MSENLKTEIDKLLSEVLNPETLYEIQEYISKKIYDRLWKLDPHTDQATIEDVLITTIQRLQTKHSVVEDVTGVPTGFNHLDKLSDGWQNGDLIVIASRPSVGKSTFALNLARNAALSASKPTSVAFFSLEMSAGQLVQRILSAESEIKLEKIARSKMEDYEMAQLYKRGILHLADAKLIIDDSPDLNIRQLIFKCKDLKTKHNIGLIIIDYLQMIDGLQHEQNREQDLSRATRELKSLAKKLQIPIIVLSQLSRDVEKRRDGNRMPQLSDLRDSGAIEENADIVCFLYRPEYHDLNQNELGANVKGETYLRIAKHRNGSLENLKFKARLEIQKFFEDDGSEFNGGFTLPPNWKPQSDYSGGAKMYIQTGTKMNDLQDDDEPF